MLKYVIPGAKYRNIKKGTIYQVFALGFDTETMRGLVVYVNAEKRSLTHQLGLWLLKIAYSLIQGERIWIRPLMLFEEKFDEHR